MSTSSQCLAHRRSSIPVLKWMSLQTEHIIHQRGLGSSRTGDAESQAMWGGPWLRNLLKPSWVPRAVWLRGKPHDTDQVNGQKSRKAARTAAKEMSCSTPASNQRCSVSAHHQRWNPLPQNKQITRPGRWVKWRKELPEWQDLTSALGGTVDQSQVKETLSGQARRVPVNLDPWTARNWWLSFLWVMRFRAWRELFNFRELQGSSEILSSPGPFRLYD